MEWRVHFHVPIFCASLGPLETTQQYVISALEQVRRLGTCAFFEVETYTWGVLPGEFRTSDVCTAIARELRWARIQLEG